MIRIVAKHGLPLHSRPVLVWHRKLREWHPAHLARSRGKGVPPYWRTTSTRLPPELRPGLAFGRLPVERGPDMLS